MTKSDIVKIAVDLSNGEPQLCAQIVVELDRIYNEAFAAGYSAGVAANPKLPTKERA